MRKRAAIGSWLTGTVIHAVFGDLYRGVIAAVAAETVRGDHTHKTTVEDVVTFADGWKLVLNKSRLLELIARFGHESDSWIGQPLDVATTGVERTNPRTGGVTVVWQRSFPVSPKAVTAAQLSTLGGVMSVHGVTPETLRAYLAQRGIPSLEAIPADQYDAIVAAVANGLKLEDR